MTSAKSKKAPRQLLHEIVGDRHRIVIVQAGSVQSGPWADLHQLAELNGYLACNKKDTPLPFGIFQVKRVEVQVLS